MILKQIYVQNMFSSFGLVEIESKSNPFYYFWFVIDIFLKTILILVLDLSRWEARKRQRTPPRLWMEPNFLEDRLVEFSDCNGDVDDAYDSHHDVIIKLMNEFHLVDKFSKLWPCCNAWIQSSHLKECMLLLTEHRSEGIKHCLLQN